MPLRIARIFLRLDLGEKGFGALLPHLLHQLHAQGGQIHAGNLLPPGQGADGVRIRPVGIDQPAVLKFPAGHRSDQHRVRPVLPSQGDIPGKILREGGFRFRIAGGILGLFVVVAELRQQVIPRLNLPFHNGKPTLVDKALGAAPALGQIDHTYPVKVIVNHLSPPHHRVTLSGIAGGSGIPRHK